MMGSPINKHSLKEMSLVVDKASGKTGTLLGMATHQISDQCEIIIWEIGWDDAQKSHYTQVGIHCLLGGGHWKRIP